MGTSKSGGQARKKYISLIEENESAKKIAHITKVFLKNITEALPQYVFWKDSQSIYLGCNKNFAQLVGLNSPDDIIGKIDNDINWQPTGHTAETFQKGDQDTVSGHPITNQEEILVLPEGKTLITLVSKLPIIDDDKVIGIVGYFTDITEIKQKEKELVKAMQQAEIANQAKSIFIMNISHDIRTPLTGMIGMARIIAKELKTEQGQKAANNLLKAGEILLDLLNEIIEIAKLDSGNLPVYEVKFSLEEIIDHIRMLVTPSVDKKKLDLTVKLDKNIPHYLIGDQTRMHRILLNLVSNAIKFTHRGGTIEIKANLAKEENRDLILKITVSDTGIGIPLEEQEVIFSRFSRLDPSYKGIYKGSGLGLSIVKQFISEIEGEIYVDSKKDQGSTFTCIIPLKKSLLDESEHKVNIGSEAQTIHKLKSYNLNIIADDDESSEQPPDQAISPEQKKVKVLLVEDNKMILFAEKHQLENFGCAIDTADTGEEALVLLKKNHYDLVFMDVGLPDENGCDVTAQIREWEKIHNCHTPIVALTAHIDENNKQRCLSVGMESVLAKPLTDESIKNTLNTFIHQQKTSSVASRDETAIDKSIKSIDLKLGTQLMNGNEEMARETLKMLVDSLPETIGKLKQLYEIEDWDQVQFETHKLNGGVSYCGVPRLQIIVKQLEDALISKDATQITMSYQDLIVEISNILSKYKNI
jgi:two-component system, OmpR family, aerobic respiration control sensor histidine kinase ArcB